MARALLQKGQMNPRYRAYCRFHGLSPEKMAEVDEKRWPGGRMCGFILWIGERLAEARQDCPTFFLFGVLCNHAGFDAWLEARVDFLLAERSEMMVALLRQFFEFAATQGQREIIFNLVRSIRKAEALRAFAQMEALGGSPYVHFMERAK